VLDGSTPLGTVRVNQELAPNDFSDAGTTWEDLGVFTICGNTLVVRLSDNANEYVIADAIRIERVGDLPPASILADDAALHQHPSTATFLPEVPLAAVEPLKSIRNIEQRMHDWNRAADWLEAAEFLAARRAKRFAASAIEAVDFLFANDMAGR
jgi:hypothetical protein